MALLSRTFSELLTFTRATTGTFIGSNGLIQTAEIDAPRFTHDPVTLEGQGFLVEEVRTNLNIRSGSLDNDVWVKTLSVQATSIPSPLSSENYYKLVPADGETFRTIRQELASSVIENTIITVSAFFKPAEWNSIRLGFTDNNGNFKVGTFNSSNESTSGIQISFVRISNTEWRVSYTDTVGSGANNVKVYVYVTNNGEIGTAGDGVSGAYVWGIQSEEGSFPTTYIPTTSAQVTRAADQCERTLTGNEFDQNQGALYAELSTKEVQAGIGLTDDTVLERIVLRRSGVGIGQALLSSDGINSTIDTDAGVYVDEGLNKLAVSWSLAGYKFSCNGQIIGSNSLPSGRVPLFTNLIIATSENLGIRSKVRTNKSCRLFPKSLSDAELIALTGGA